VGNENTGKKLVATAISLNNKAMSDKRAVWKRKHFTLTLDGEGRHFWTFILTAPSITNGI
jgi:hypothetical protein